jgi:hypothetical protein
MNAMLGFAWLTVRQAQEALRAGRLEEAQRLLEQPDVLGQRGAADVLLKLAAAYAERGERALARDDAEGAWHELLAAERLQTADRAGDRLRQALVRLGLAEVRALLQANEPLRADQAAAALRARSVRVPELQVLEEAIKAWLSAREMADHGELGPAVEALDRAAKLLGAPAYLAAARADLERRREAFTGLIGRLHEAAEGARWREVSELAEQVLAVAPQHNEARRARGRAWKAVEPVTVAMGPAQANGEAHDEPLTPRFLLWIDGVGGYLVCLGSRLTLGQHSLDARADVPLLADVSRVHATLSRDSEGYVIEATQNLRVNNQPTTRALLKSNDRLTLGTTCQLQFRQPVPVSATARLDVMSGHRLPLSVDGVLLMADTLLLGAGPQAHVVVPELKQPVVLFRHKDGLGLKHTGALTVDGQQCPERGLLRPSASVVGPDVTFALEPVGDRM